MIKLVGHFKKMLKLTSIWGTEHVDMFLHSNMLLIYKQNTYYFFCQFLYNLEISTSSVAPTSTRKTDSI